MWELKVKGDKSFGSDNSAEKTQMHAQIEDAAIAAFDQFVQQLGDHYETLQSAVLTIDGVETDLHQGYEDAQIEEKLQAEEDEEAEAEAEIEAAAEEEGQGEGKDVDTSDGGSGKTST